MTGAQRSERLLRTGRVWIFGDAVSTDLMIPSRAVRSAHTDWTAEQWCFAATRPSWSTSVQVGDLILAGRNFGCGSGRAAPEVLRRCGIAGIAAKSMARTFFRNAVSAGIPVMICPDLPSDLVEGAVHTIDFDSGVVSCEEHVLCVGEALPADSPPGQIVRAGGFEPFLAHLLALQPHEREQVLGVRMSHTTQREQA